jgi:hypothetical protein
MELNAVVTRSTTLHFYVMNPKEQFAMPSAMPPSGRCRKPAFTTLTGSLMKRLEATFTAWLDQNVEADGRPALDPQHMFESIRAGDVVLAHEPLYQVPLR